MDEIGSQQITANPCGEPKGIASGIPVWCAFSAIVDPAKLNPHPRNDNTHTDSQINELAYIIQRQGWRRAIKVSTRSGLITCGHGIRLAALKLAVKEVPIDYQDYPDEQHEIADVMADNQMARKAVEDFTIKADNLMLLDDGAFDMRLTGYDEAERESIATWTPNNKELVDAEPQVDRAEELNKKWKVKIGDLFGIGKFTRCPKCGKIHNLDGQK